MEELDVALIAAAQSEGLDALTAKVAQGGAQAAIVTTRGRAISNAPRHGRARPGPLPVAPLHVEEAGSGPALCKGSNC